MKKTLYLFTFVAMVFTACQKQPIVPLYTTPQATTDMSIALAASDYQLLPTTAYPYKTLTFDDDADAEYYIPTILNSKYAKLADGSTIAVTYTKSPLYFKPNADSLYADVAYTLTSADYLLLPNNKYTDFSLSQVLAWLPYKYPTPTANELKLLTFTPYPATLTPPYSFIYYSGSWRMAYTITPAQYASIGLGKYNQITTTNDAQLHSTLGAFLKNDITITDTVKAGDIEFVSFDYYASGNAYQRVIPLEYDGNNFVAPQSSTGGPVNFIKKAGKWEFVQPLPVIAYTLTTADNTLIVNGAAGSATAKSNLGQYGDFSSSWTLSDLNAAMIEVLTADFTTPETNTIYAVTFNNYNAVAPDPLKFIWDGTKWVAQQ